MPPKNDATVKKSILISPSRAVSSPEQLAGGEEIEIAAQISLPSEGGWGWLVVASSLYCIAILDGTVFTFGSLISDISEDIGIADSLVALINSIAVAMYFITSPLASALINRFGFRACAMSGSIVCAFGLFTTYFVANFVAICVFYGFVNGFGNCLINMAASLIVGFYFEKLRPVAIAISTSGSSLGMMLLNPLNSYIVDVAGWRAVMLLHSSLFATIYFVSMTFRPLLSLTVMQTTDDPTRTVTYLPNLSSAALKASVSRTRNEALTPNVAERLFNAVSNAHFPTAAAVVDEGIGTTVASSSSAGPSAPAVSKLTLTAYTPQGGISRRQLKQVKSIVSRSNMQDKSKKNIEITIKVDEQPGEGHGCCGRCCRWEKHVPESRPMYRDDAFYQGDMKKLPAYQKSMMDTSADAKTGIEYQLAVSRAATANDLQERRGVFTTAVRRVLATMMDPKLLKQKSFVLLSLWGFFAYSGFLVPLVFLKIKSEEAGIESEHCSLFVSVIGFATLVGRLSLGVLACYVDPIILLFICTVVCGTSSIVSTISNGIHFQYCYCFIYGFFLSGGSSLRSMVIVSLYGLEKLTNATGMLLLFQGVGSLISTPVAGALKDALGFAISFYASGIVILLGGLCLVPVKLISMKNARLQAVQNSTNKNNTK